jgi:predicted GNAT superfamily acetyltransferase
MEKDQESIELRVLQNAEEIKPVEELQKLVWPGSDVEVVPLHMLVSVAQNSGLLVGAYDNEQLIGFVYGFIGLHHQAEAAQTKHCSHMLAVHPDYRDTGVGARLKRAQWQLVRQQGLELITWTYDPLESRNAYFNIAKLGAICNTYKPNHYGEMGDDLNSGIPSDRFQVDWWVNSHRVLTRLGRKPQSRFDLAHYLAADISIINQTRLNDADLPQPFKDSMDTLESPDTRPQISLFEIPGDFQALKAADLDLGPPMAVVLPCHF